MGTIIDYSTLIASVQQVTEDDGVEMSTYIPIAIDLAEERLLKELDMMDLDKKFNQSCVIGSPLLNKPADYKITKHLAVFNASGRTLLKKRTEDFLEDYWPNATLLAMPKYYADSVNSQFLLAPTPDVSYTVELRYVAQPTKLSLASPVNIFITQTKDILFAATMVEIALFQKAWSQVDVWNTKFTTLRDDYNVQEMRKRRDNGEAPRNPDGNQNTLKQAAQTGG